MIPGPSGSSNLGGDVRNQARDVNSPDYSLAVLRNGNF